MGGVLVSDRNRWEFRLIGGEYSWRYRNRLSVEKELTVGRVTLNPYYRAEIYYDSRFDEWTRTVIAAALWIAAMNAGREKEQPMLDLIITTLKIVCPLSVALIVFAQGLKISPGEVAIFFKERPWLLLRSLVAVLVLVPAVALAIILLLHPSREVAVGLAILVACPPAPLMLKATPQLGKGSAAYMAALHVGLATLAFCTVPSVLYLLSMPLGFHADVDLLKMGWILARTILIPIALGTAIRAYYPRVADAIGPGVDKAGGIGLLVVLLFAAARFVPWLEQMDYWSYLVIVVVSAAALTIGHWSGSRDPHERTTLAVESGVRHPVLALTIGVLNFTPANALPVLVPCVLVFIAVAMAYMLWRRRGEAAAYPSAAVS